MTTATVTTIARLKRKTKIRAPIEVALNKAHEVEIRHVYGEDIWEEAFSQASKVSFADRDDFFYHGFVWGPVEDQVRYQEYFDRIRNKELARLQFDDGSVLNVDYPKVYSAWLWS